MDAYIHYLLTSRANDNGVLSLVDVNQIWEYNRIARCPVFNRTDRYFGSLSGIKMKVIPNNACVRYLQSSPYSPFFLQFAAR